MAITTITFILTSAVFACAVHVWLNRCPKTTPHLPPGPPADPIIGHLRMIPPEGQADLFNQWYKTYGDVMHLWIPGRSMIVLSTIEAATELLDKRSSIYSDRPSFTVLEMMGWRPNLGLMPYGKQFQKHRKMIQQYFMPKNCETYRHIQNHEVQRLLKNLLDTPLDIENHLRGFSTGIILQLISGHQITSNDDPYMMIAEKGGEALNNCGPPGSTPVDLLPFLRYFPSWFPGTFYAFKARELNAAVRRMHDFPFDAVKKLMAEGCAKPSFLLTSLENLNQEGSESEIDDEDVKGAAATIYSAGGETTWSSILVFMLAMILHPDCQSAAQKEIDEVLGFGRFPSFGDRASLPYVECILQESLRWQSVAPTGIPHRVLEDDVYNGMLIPKGSLVIANIRAMSLDEKVYADPYKFKPSRFLPKPAGRDEPHSIAQFGFGRRICPGRHLADASVWIAIASILAAFNISKAIGEDGREITPEVAFTCGISNHPKSIRCIIKPRNEEARAAIMQLNS